MRHISHKCADLIMDHNYDEGPLELYGGYADEFESVLGYVVREARLRNTRLRVTWNRGHAVIRKA